MMKMAVRRPLFTKDEEHAALQAGGSTNRLQIGHELLTVNKYVNIK